MVGAPVHRIASKVGDCVVHSHMQNDYIVKGGPSYL